MSPIKCTIIDYGMGNLFSIKHACNFAGIDATISSDPGDLEAADIAVLPGVGAFGDAMNTLHRLDLISPIKDFAQTGKPLVGICLGQQILMSESEEFGSHRGLGLIEGTVRRLENPREGSKNLKVPHVGWNSLWAAKEEAQQGFSTNAHPPFWEGSLMQNVPNGEQMYFVHSYCTRPVDDSVALTWTKYGDIVFCSSIRYKNITAFQHHPERSAMHGLTVYVNMARSAKAALGE